jgi:hypothetical protein
VAASDDAYQYDRNPNSIRPWTLQVTLPEPAVAARPSCLPMGAIGVMLSGAVVFNALDAEGRDAPAHEILDACGGHPERSGIYHYHALSPCLRDAAPATAHSSLLGYALDGFGIYGPRGEGGKTLASAGLDACHGHTHQVLFRGASRRVYHYHLTAGYPYTLGCFKGTPATLPQPSPGPGPPGGGPPPGDGPPP